MEERLDRDIDAKERIVAFIPAYAAYFYNGLHSGDDGKVAYEGVKGKKPTAVGLGFGEKVLHMRPRGVKLEKDKVKMGVWNFCGSESEK
eukprot:5411558-Karenia_brevis.AAC.1